MIVIFISYFVNCRPVAKCSLYLIFVMPVLVKDHALYLLGVKKFMALGIPSSKIVLGIPWYGYDYPCVRFSQVI